MALNDHDPPGPDGYDAETVERISELLRDATGSPVTDELLEAAHFLIHSVHTDNAAHIFEALRLATAVTGDEYRGVLGIATVLAAAADHDVRITHLVEWITEKPLYHRLRAGGMSHREAARTIVGIRDGERGNRARALVDAGLTAEDLQRLERPDDDTPPRHLHLVAAPDQGGDR